MARGAGTIEGTIQGISRWHAERGQEKRWQPKRRTGGVSAGAALLLTLVILCAAAGSAAAATVSGVLKNGKGFRVVLVQANGTAKKATISKQSGAFAIRGVKLAGASLQLVRGDGSYFGPIVLKTSATKAFCTIKGAASLKVGKATLKSSYALVKTVPSGRFDMRPAYTAKAVRGRPVGAGKLGRVTTGEPSGLRGPGADLDRDGIVGAFDIDDNGNLILDNVDRTGRGSGRPLAQRSAAGPTAAAPSASLLGGSRDDPPPPPPGPKPPPGPQPDQEFRMFSNFKLTNQTSINVSIPGLVNVDELIAREVPRTVSLATQVIGGSQATLDGLGNSYLQPHTLAGVTYPQVNFAPPTYTGTSLNISKLDMDAQISPGALPSEIGPGDSFIQTAPDGVSYPGMLNFVFNTAPALKSYQFNTDAAPTEMVYDGSGVAWPGMTPGTRLVVPAGATSIALTWWRPQRKAGPGETGNADGWVDIGGLGYNADIPNAAQASEGGPFLSGTHNARGAYSNAASNGVPIATTSTDESVIDPATDAPANPANTLSFTVSFPAAFSEWATFGSGTVFDFDIQARSEYGDNAARKLCFVLQ
jgi:hypothetical protein